MKRRGSERLRDFILPRTNDLARVGRVEFAAGDRAAVAGLSASPEAQDPAARTVGCFAPRASQRRPALSGRGWRVLAARRRCGPAAVSRSDHGAARRRRQIARHFGGAGCATHSPTVGRPGRVGRDFQAALEATGFRLATAHDCVVAGSLVEVYPHPALLRLMKTARRVPYKVGKTGSYWPGRPHAEQVALVRAELWRIAERLDTLVAGTRTRFEALVNGHWTLTGLKPAEDVLDAIILARVGVVALAGCRRSQVFWRRHLGDLSPLRRTRRIAPGVGSAPLRLEAAIVAVAPRARPRHDRRLRSQLSDRGRGAGGR